MCKFSKGTRFLFTQAIIIAAVLTILLLLFLVLLLIIYCGSAHTKKVKGVPSLSKCVQCFKHCTDTEQQVLIHVLKSLQFK